MHTVDKYQECQKGRYQKKIFFKCVKMHTWQVWGNPSARPIRPAEGQAEHGRIQSYTQLRQNEAVKPKTNVIRLVPKSPEFQYRLCLRSSQAGNRQNQRVASVPRPWEGAVDCALQPGMGRRSCHQLQFPTKRPAHDTDHQNRHLLALLRLGAEGLPPPAQCSASILEQP